jgi:hypothetical protein
MPNDKYDVKSMKWVLMKSSMQIVALPWAVIGPRIIVQLIRNHTRFDDNVHVLMYMSYVYTHKI